MEPGEREIIHQPMTFHEPVPVIDFCEAPKNNRPLNLHVVFSDNPKVIVVDVINQLSLSRLHTPEPAKIIEEFAIPSESIAIELIGLVTKVFKRQNITKSVLCINEKENNIAHLLAFLQNKPP